MLKKWLLFSALFLLSISSTWAEDNKELSLPYTTQSNCDIQKDKNNRDYPSYTRSNCFEKSSKYYYYICSEESTSCTADNVISEKTPTQSSWSVWDEISNLISDNSSSENPYAKLLSKSLLSKVWPVVRRINALDLKKAKTILAKLEKISGKYKSNKVVTNLIWFLKFELNKIIAQKSETEGVSDFLCDLTGDCDKSTKPDPSTNVDTWTGFSQEQPISSEEENSASNNPSDAPIVEVTPLMKEDVGSKWYGFGSMKTLVWTHDWKKVTIFDKGSRNVPNAAPASTIPTSINGIESKALRYSWFKWRYIKWYDFDTIYSVRHKLSPEDRNPKWSHGKLWLYPDNGFIWWTQTADIRGAAISISQIPWYTWKSEFTGHCSLRKWWTYAESLNSRPEFTLVTQEYYDTLKAEWTEKYGSKEINLQTSLTDRTITVVKPWTPEMEAYIQKLIDHNKFCMIPHGTTFYFNIELDKSKNSKCLNNPKYPCNVDAIYGLSEATPFDRYKNEDVRTIEIAYDKVKAREPASKKFDYSLGTTRVRKGWYLVWSDWSCWIRNLFTWDCTCSTWFSPDLWWTNNWYTSYGCYNNSTGQVNWICWSVNGWNVSGNISVSQMCTSWVPSKDTIWATQTNKTFMQLYSLAWLGCTSKNCANDWKYATFKWGCWWIGTNVSRDNHCSATFSRPAISGTCWSSAWKTMTSQPTSGLCNRWTPTNINMYSGWNRWSWFCQWQNHWTSVLCQTFKKQ